MKLAKISLLLMATAAAPAHAQSSGLVSVDLREVAPAIAQRSGLDESMMPLSIQVPPEVAATACGVAPASMAQQATRGGEGCTARTSTPELERVVTQRMKADEAATSPTRASGVPGD